MSINATARSFIRLDAQTATGTGYQGRLAIPFTRIVEVFGEPDESPSFKSAFEWVIQFADGTVACIYDYRASSRCNTNNPTPDQMRANDFCDWHVGGRGPRAMELLRAALTVDTSKE
jgi:hypothetical protein